MRPSAWLPFLAVFLFAVSAHADPLKIRVGWSTMPGHLIPVLFSKPEILKHYGKTYTVEPIAFRGSSPQITALAAHEVDLIASAPSTMALAVANAHIDMRVVLDLIQDGAPGFHSETYFVRSDSGLKTPADLKGKRVGTNAVGSASDTAMRAVLAKAGLDPRRDVNTIEAAFPAMPSLLEERKVDLAVVLLPRMLEMEKDPAYKVLFRAKDAWGSSDLVFLAGRADFLEQNHQAVQDFVEDTVRALRWFEDPANHAEAVAIVARFMKVEPKDLDYLFTHDDYFRDPWARPDIASIQKVIDASKQLGVLPATIQVAPQHVDADFLAEARKRIEASP